MTLLETPLTEHLKRAIGPCVLAALLALLLAGCSSPSSSSGSGSASASAAAESQSSGTQAASTQAASDAASYTFTDDAGNEVTVESHNRVVACMGSFARIWELAGGELVGASDDAFDSYDLDDSIAKVGDFSAPSTEAILALEPDFVIMTSGSGGRGGSSSQVEAADVLRDSGVPVALFQVTTFDDYLHMLETCTDITGDEAAYEENGLAVQSAIADIVAKAPQGDSPTALAMITYSGGARVQNSSTMVGAMLADLGVTNIADENPSLLSDFSIEALAEIDPDYVFVLPMGNNDEASARALAELTNDNPAWEQLSAVQAEHVVQLDSAHFLNKPNEKWAESYQILFDSLYA